WRRMDRIYLCEPGLRDADSSCEDSAGNVGRNRLSNHSWWRSAIDLPVLSTRIGLSSGTSKTLSGGAKALTIFGIFVPPLCTRPFSAKRFMGLVRRRQHAP